MSAKKYKEFNIFFEPASEESFLHDLISGFLWQLNILGLSAFDGEEKNLIKVFADEKSLLNKQEISDKLQQLMNENLLKSFKVEENILEDKNWNEEWEKSIDVIEISDRIIIKPSFRNYIPKKNAEGKQIIITIDPKMSFGTGEHPTTKLVLLFLEKYLKENSKVLDIGTGTGILSIASVKLGASSVLSIDIDEWSIENSKENIKLNEVEDKIEVRLSTSGLNQIKENEHSHALRHNFDLILANIQKDVLLNIAEEIKNKLKKGGTLILSGLLADDEKDILKKYEELNFSVVEKKELGEWIGIVLTLRE